MSKVLHSLLVTCVAACTWHKHLLEHALSQESLWWVLLEQLANLICHNLGWIRILLSVKALSSLKHFLLPEMKFLSCLATLWFSMSLIWNTLKKFVNLNCSRGVVQ